MPVPGGKFTYQYTVTNIGRKTGRFNITAAVDNYVSKASEQTKICRRKISVRKYRTVNQK